MPSLRPKGMRAFVSSIKLGLGFCRHIFPPIRYAYCGGKEKAWSTSEKIHLRMEENEAGVCYTCFIEKSEGMEKQQYVCEKCGNMHYVSDQFQATGGNFAKIFDVQNKNLLQLAVPNAATPNFTAAKQAAA